LLEPGYPDSVVFYFFLKFMLDDDELIPATCIEYGRPTFSSCRLWQWLRLGFFITRLIKALFINKLSCVAIQWLIISRLARFNFSVVFQVLQHCGLKYCSETSAKRCFIALFNHLQHGSSLN